jgi:hypothetical protein
MKKLLFFTFLYEKFAHPLCHGFVFLCEFATFLGVKISFRIKEKPEDHYFKDNFNIHHSFTMIIIAIQCVNQYLIKI